MVEKLLDKSVRRDIQQALVDSGFNLGTYGPNQNGVDGSIGGSTRRAIQEFEEQRGLAVDGQIDIAMLTALFANKEPSEQIAKGVGSLEVRIVQHMLSEVAAKTNNNELDPGSVDGDFGNQTEQAVKAFQRSQGEEETGIVTPVLFRTIQRAYGISPSATEELTPVAGPSGPETVKTDITAEITPPETVPAAAAPAMIPAALEPIGDAPPVISAYPPLPQKAPAISYQLDPRDAQTQQWALQTLGTPSLAAFQKAHSLSETGEMDNATAAALQTAIASREFMSGEQLGERSQSIRYGSQGADAQRFKQGLVELHYLTANDANAQGRADKVDDVALQAIKDFQSDNRLQPDGKVGGRTWNAMREALNEPPLTRHYANEPVEYIPPAPREPGPPYLGYMPSGEPRILSPRERYLLANITYWEAQGESEMGQQAVMETILNRVGSDYRNFREQNTVNAVVFAQNRSGYEFQPVGEGKMSRDIPRAAYNELTTMADELMQGERPAVAGGALFFGNLDLMNSLNRAYFNSLGGEVKIGQHTFFKADVDAAQRGQEEWRESRKITVHPAGDPHQPETRLVIGEQPSRLPVAEAPAEASHAALSPAPTPVIPANAADISAEKR